MTEDALLSQLIKKFGKETDKEALAQILIDDTNQWLHSSSLKADQ